MKNYLLLRDNKQSGPYTFDEITRLALKKSDLIWIEGESLHWEFVTAFEDLKPFIVSIPPVNVYVPAPAAPRVRTDFRYKPGLEIPRTENSVQKRAAISTTPAAISKPAKPLIEIKERSIPGLKDQKFQFGRRSSKNNGAWIMALMFMLIGSAFVIKKIIETNDMTKERKPVAAAVPLAGIPEGSIREKQADISYKNALSMEVSSADTTEIKNKKISLNELKRKVSVSVNNYKVGMFGGVDDLQLNVHNGSSVTIDKVNVQVIFLKPNGQEVNSTLHSVYSLPAGNTKILVVPPSKHGVKVKYFVTGVESKEPLVSKI